jgi:hypothetical protein
MDVVFLAPAQAEFAEAVMYYNAQRGGLGEEFAEEVQRTIARISEYPKNHPLAAFILSPWRR